MEIWENLSLENIWYEHPETGILTEERWLSILDFEGYYNISDLGRIKNLSRYKSIPNRKDYLSKESIKKNYSHKYGYRLIDLNKNSIKTKESVHRIVAFHFVENPDNLPYVMHLDDIPYHNMWWNLKWGNQQDNMNLKVQNNRQNKGITIPSSKLTDEIVKEIRNNYNKKSCNQYKLSEIYNVSQSVINEVINYKTWKHI